MDARHKGIARTGHPAGQGFAGQAGQFQLFGQSFPLQLELQPVQRMGGADLLIPVGGKEQGGRFGQMAGQVVQPGQRRIVSPVQVFQHQQEGVLPRQVEQEEGQGVKEAGLLLVGGEESLRRGWELLVQFRGQTGQFGHLPGRQALQSTRPRGGEDGMQEVRQRAVGQSTLVLVAASTGSPAAPLLDVLAQFLDQAGLADASLTAHQHQVALARPGSLPMGQQPLPLGLPSHEGGALQDEGGLAARRRAVLDESLLAGFPSPGRAQQFVTQGNRLRSRLDAQFGAQHSAAPPGLSHRLSPVAQPHLQPDGRAMHILSERVAGQKQPGVAQCFLRLIQCFVDCHQPFQRRQVEPLQAVALFQAPVVVEALQEVALVQVHGAL